MRIADKMNFEQVKTNLNKNRSEMSTLQNQAATQKKLTRPADDPIAATRVLQSRSEISGNNQFIKSVNQAKTFLEYSDQSLGELSDVLTRAKELAISQSNDASASSETRKVTAEEIDQLFSQAVQVGNRKHGDRFIFGGYKTTKPPFDPNGKYLGDSGEIKIPVQKEGAVAMNIPGNRIFHGTSAEKGQEQRPVSSSKISPDSYENVELSSGEVPEDQAQTAGLRGPASVESSLSSKEAIEGERQSGLTSDWKNEGVNIFNILAGLSTSMRANDKEGIQESLDLLDKAFAQVVLGRASLGSRIMTLNSAMETLQKGQVEQKSLVSTLEDVDTVELVSDLNKTESTLKASLATSGKLIQSSLLDFLK